MKNFLIVTLALIFSLQASAAAVNCSVAADEIAAPKGKDLKEIDFDAAAKVLMDRETSDRLTIEVMKQAQAHEAAGTDTIKGWLSSIHEAQRQQPLDVLQHSALLFMYKSGTFGDVDHRDSLIVLEDTLKESYAHLVGHDVTLDQSLTPLPGDVLRSTDERSRVFHDAVFEEFPVAKGTAFSRLKGAIERAQYSTIVTSMMGLAALTTEPGREGFAGALIGLTEAGLNEYMIHIGVGHAPKSAGTMFRKFGRVGKFLEEITLAHKLHHSVVAQDFGAATLSPDQKQIADKTLRKLVQNLIAERMMDELKSKDKAAIEAMPDYQTRVESLIQAVQKSNYGVDGTVKGAAGMLVAATPFYLLNYALYRATGSHTFLVSADLSMTVMIIQSLYSHWHMHFRPQDNPDMKVNRLQQWYMSTPVGRLALRLHFVHHETPYAYERTKNGDIMAWQMADRIQGSKGVKNPTVKDLVEMYFQGFLPMTQNLMSPQ